ncbi:hypothetical protein T4B_10630 [Trichinella pseudospiralis]|uniref:Uncharacterized protein n=1 Tax=Trichinella pseudospiralis TaxID=6337 RepID=A0A0V1HUN1_TRIPS|nr:hypothetical protein T4B_10630 [Trichinella pseudospiralis]
MKNANKKLECFVENLFCNDLHNCLQMKILQAEADFVSEMQSNAKHFRYEQLECIEDYVAFIQSCILIQLKQSKFEYVSQYQLLHGFILYTSYLLFHAAQCFCTSIE